LIRGHLHIFHLPTRVSGDEGCRWEGQAPGAGTCIPEALLL